MGALRRVGVRAARVGLALVGKPLFAVGLALGVWESRLAEAQAKLKLERRAAAVRKNAEEASPPNDVVRHAHADLGRRSQDRNPSMRGLA